MPTLLEKPTTAAPISLSSELLRKRHRWERWRTALIVALVGLTVTLAAIWTCHVADKNHGDWKLLAAVWIGGLLLTLLAAWFGRHFAPATLVDTAQHLDERLTAKNRLEAAATLHRSESPLALAQREETEAFLRGAASILRPTRLLPWLIGSVLFLVAVHLVTMGTWLSPLLKQPSAAPVPPAKKELPHATITWKSPEPETKANPVEEVPTVAVADSNSGLKNLTLEISVNGIAKKSVPVPASPFDKPGAHTIKMSLYMDDLGVEPFDIVSYFIRGRRIASQPLPDTASPIQFIQVRPFRDDVMTAPGGEPENPDYNLLIRLKLAELRSVKENFVLSHTDLPPTDPVRVKENDRVGKNQGALATKTEEAVQAFIQDGMPAEIIDLLQQAEPPMKDAAGKILAGRNAEALPSQQKALSLIVEVEKFFRKIMSDKMSSSPPDNNPADPFKDKQQHEMKKRMETAAGQLEQLAKNQTKLAGDLSQSDASGSQPQTTPASPQRGDPLPQSKPHTSPNGTPAPADTSSDDEEPTPQSVDPFKPDTGNSTHAERQARVLQGIGTLLNSNTVLPAAVTDALHEAQKAAASSQHALDQSDDDGAREPAADAAQALQKAVEAMNKAGEEQTKLEMEEAQQKLNDEAQKMQDMAQPPPANAGQDLSHLAKEVHDTQKQLEDAADKQQESGSAAGAQRLDQLAKDMARQGVEKELAAMSKRGFDSKTAQADADKLATLAAEAAREANAGKLSAHDLGELVDSLQTSRANLEHLAQMADAAPNQTKAGQSGSQPESTPPQDASGKNGQPQQGNVSGQGPGTGQDANTPAAQGTGQQPGADQGQAPGQGKDQGKGEEEAMSNDTSQGGDAQHNGGGNGVGGASGPGVGTPASIDKAYREVLSDLRDQAQQAKAALPETDVSSLINTVQQAQRIERGSPHSISNLPVSYQTVAAPLDQLIREVQQALIRAQRDEVVKQPDLDEAPAAYRSAVSDYFESMSKNYHPDSRAPDASKP